MKLKFNWAPGTILAFAIALIVPIYTLTISFFASVGTYSVIGVTLFTLVTLLFLGIISSIKAKRFFDTADAYATYSILKRAALASTVLFAIHIIGTLTQVVLVEELNQYPPHWSFVLDHTELCMHYILTFPRLLPPLTFVLFAVSCIWPLTTVFFKFKR